LHVVQGKADAKGKQIVTTATGKKTPSRSAATPGPPERERTITTPTSTAHSPLTQVDPVLDKKYKDKLYSQVRTGVKYRAGVKYRSGVKYKSGVKYRSEFKYRSEVTVQNHLSGE
jgi:hypothetical protein